MAVKERKGNWNCLVHVNAMHTEHVNITKLGTRMDIHCLPCSSFVQRNCAADSEECVNIVSS